MFLLQLNKAYRPKFQSGTQFHTQSVGELQDMCNETCIQEWDKFVAFLVCLLRAIMFNKQKDQIAFHLLLNNSYLFILEDMILFYSINHQLLKYCLYIVFVILFSFYDYYTCDF